MIVNCTLFVDLGIHLLIFTASCRKRQRSYITSKEVMELEADQSAGYRQFFQCAWSRGAHSRKPLFRDTEAATPVCLELRRDLSSSMEAATPCL